MQETLSNVRANEARRAAQVRGVQYLCRICILSLPCAPTDAVRHRLHHQCRAQGRAQALRSCGAHRCCTRRSRAHGDRARGRRRKQGHAGGLLPHGGRPPRGPGAALRQPPRCVDRSRGRAGCDLRPGARAQFSFGSSRPGFFEPLPQPVQAGKRATPPKDKKGKGKADGPKKTIQKAPVQPVSPTPQRDIEHAIYMLELMVRPSHRSS